MKNDYLINKNSKADFCIEIDFEKGSESPSRVFRTMTELIDTFQEIDADLVKSVDAKIEPIVIIEDIEAGSLKAWFSYILKAIDDDSLKDIDWKPAIGKYLVKGKYFLLNFLEGKTQITSKEEIKQLEEGLFNLSKETDVIRFPAYFPIKRQKLLPHIEKISNSLVHLGEKDKAFYKTPEDYVCFNAEFQFVPENIEELLTKETLRSKTEMILKVKKPDYLGESQWEFRHETKAIHAKILDINWLKEFQKREHDVRPGDSLRAKVETIVNYGYDNEVVATNYNIIKVVEVIPVEQSNQLQLLPPENKK